MPDEYLTMKEASALSGDKHSRALYHWAEVFPELFRIEKREGFSRRYSITRENLAEVMRRRAGYGPEKRLRLRPNQPRKAPGPSVATRTGIQKGWWCRHCDAILPMANRLCRCLNGAEVPAAIQRFKAEYWEPATVNPRVVLGGTGVRR